METSTFIDGPEPKLQLIYNDVWLPGLYSRRILVFKQLASSESVVAILKKALKALVLGTPELGGKVVAIPKEDHDGEIPWRAIVPYKGVELIVKDLSTGSSFPSFMELEHKGFPVRLFKDDMLMPIPKNVGPEPQPVAKFQLSFIDGGFFLSTCIDHRLSDGTGMNTIMRMLGEACKQATDSATHLTPIVLNTDRSLLQALQPSSQADISLHPAHIYVPNGYAPKIFTSGKKTSEEPAPALDTAATPPSRPSNFVPTSFHITSPSALHLKEDASPSDSTWISRHDAIIALLWLTTIRARYSLGLIRPTDTTSYGFPCNSRSKLGLPADWVGNSIYFCDASLPVSAFLPLVSSTHEEETSKLRVLASKIRSTIQSVDHARVSSALTLRRADPYSLLWWHPANPGEPKILGVSSFYHAEFLLTDWGSVFGPVQHFTTSDLGFIADGFQRISYVGPKIDKAGGCNVVVGADPQELEFFKNDRLWNRYFELSERERI